PRGSHGRRESRRRRCSGSTPRAPATTPPHSAPSAPTWYGLPNEEPGSLRATAVRGGPTEHAREFDFPPRPATLAGKPSEKEAAMPPTPPYTVSAPVSN